MKDQPELVFSLKEMCDFLREWIKKEYVSFDENANWKPEPRTTDDCTPLTFNPEGLYKSSNTCLLILMYEMFTSSAIRIRLDEKMLAYVIIISYVTFEDRPGTAKRAQLAYFFPEEIWRDDVNTSSLRFLNWITRGHDQHLEPTLVLLPSRIVLSQWPKNIFEWFPDMKVVIFHSQNPF